MRKGEILVIGLFLIMALSFVSAQPFETNGFFRDSVVSNFNCSQYGVECGSTSVLKDFTESQLFYYSCGTCDSGKACIYGKCTPENLLGKCERKKGFFETCSDINSVTSIYPNPSSAAALSYLEQRCSWFGCNYDNENKCTGNLPSCSSYIEPMCLDSGCGFDESTQTCIKDGSKVAIAQHNTCLQLNCTWSGDIQTGICTQGNDPSICSSNLAGIVMSNIQGNSALCEAVSDTRLNKGLDYCFTGQIGGCELSGTNSLKSKFYLNNNLLEFIEGTPYPNVVSLTNEDLKSIMGGSTITVLMKLENSGLPKATQVSFEIYNTYSSQATFDEEGNLLEEHWPTSETNEIREGENAVKGIVDEKGDVSVEWLLSKEDLDKMDKKGYDGESQIEIGIRINGILFSRIMNGQRGDYNLLLKTKTGECSGTLSCPHLTEIPCHALEQEGCVWNKETKSCSGQMINGPEGSIQCNNLEYKDYCKFFKCSWKANNIFERFADWVKGIFGR